MVHGNEIEGSFGNFEKDVEEITHLCDFSLLEVTQIFSAPDSFVIQERGIH